MSFAAPGTDPDPAEKVTRPTKTLTASDLPEKGGKVMQVTTAAEKMVFGIDALSPGTADTRTIPEGTLLSLENLGPHPEAPVGQEEDLIRVTLPISEAEGGIGQRIVTVSNLVPLVVEA